MEMKKQYSRNILLIQKFYIRQILYYDKTLCC